MYTNKLVFNISKANMILLESDEIIYFEKKLKKIIAHLSSSQKVVPISISMKELCTLLEEKKLLNKFFFRCHCSFIVNIKYIDIIKHSNVFLSTGDEVPVSNARKKQFYKFIQTKVNNYD